MSAILFDFDLSDALAVATAREILGALKESALEEENTAFDPSGSSTHIEKDGEHVSFERAAPYPDLLSVRSQETDLISVSNDFHSLDVGSESESESSGASRNTREKVAEIERLDDATKIALLKGMFPEATDFAISHTLKMGKGCWNRAMEELLNHAFFDAEDMTNGEDRIKGKGVDAFSDDNTVRRGRKKRDKRKSRRREMGEEQRASSVPTTRKTNGTQSPWQRGIKDIDFISSHVQVPKHTVSSLYHQNGASVSATIIALLESTAVPNYTPRIPSGDPVVQAHAYELGTDFPSIPPTTLTRLIRLTHPSTAAAHELAKALTYKPSANIYGSLEIITRYAPSNPSDETSTPGWSTPPSRTRSSTPNPTSTITPSALVTTYSLAHAHAQSQASAFHRKARSDHLLSGAASYYSQLSREYAIKRSEAAVAAADTLVSFQSNNNGCSGEIDLHGVSVKDAVRISRLCTESWWGRRRVNRVVGLDGRVARDGEGEGLRIVTGMGRHSDGGRGRIGPAVSGMLEREGWWVVYGEGAVTVTGKRK